MTTYEHRTHAAGAGLIPALFRWLFLTLAVWVAAYIVPGIGYDRWQSLLVASLVLGVLNSFVKPVLLLMSLPFIILSLGLFLIVINALLLKLTAMVVPGFHVASFWSALGGSLVISLVSVFLGLPRRSARVVVSRGGDDTVERRRGPPPGKGPVIDV